MSHIHGALCPDFCEFDENVGRYLVCFSEFDGFLAEEDQKHVLTKLKTRSTTIPGFHMDDSAKEVQLVTQAIASRHQEDMTTFFFNTCLALVSCNCKVKFLVTESRNNLSDIDWQNKLFNYLNHFKVDLGKYFFPLNDALEVWGRRKYFLCCFLGINVKKDKELLRITQHLFFMCQMESMLRFIDRVYQAWHSNDYGGLNMECLKEAIQLRKLDHHLNKANRNGYKCWMMIGQEFSGIFTYEGRQDAYNTESIYGLITFIHNANKHYADMQYDNFLGQNIQLLQLSDDMPTVLTHVDYRLRLLYVLFSKTSYAGQGKASGPLLSQGRKKLMIFNGLATYLGVLMSVYKNKRNSFHKHKPLVRWIAKAKDITIHP